MARTSRNATPCITSKTTTPILNGRTPSSSSSSLNGLSHFRQKLEQQLKQQLENESSEELKTSPTLEKLKMTPGRVVKDRQLLMKKHLEARQKADTLHIGGGFTLWPNMDDMRLNKQEGLQLLLTCILLFCFVIFAFYKIHGEVIRKLIDYHSQLKQFHSLHPVMITGGQHRFTESVLEWHKDYKALLEDIHSSFDVLKFPKRYILYISLYVVGMGLLLYYLVDNMFAKMEGAIEQNVHQLGEVLGNAVETDIDLTKFDFVLSYWRTRCLPPSTHGTLNILGILAVRDVMHYFQYYSLPVITVLLTPVIKLIMSLRSVYCFLTIEIVILCYNL
ncbi:hypothetical protein KUTeg_017964 [Tegillarca granosa]|uniref:Uncharacterized protein n=1 Tax=Tegillarca granosa TaxID=220873 RepID=A0ABQ9EIY1_TEGGR|nr:hypothetical protein KUTeg_017964 [Tegillarca granosa]